MDKNENSSVLIIILYFLNLILISILLFNYFLNWKFNEAYFNAAPNRFRLQIQFMIFLNNIGFSYFYSLIFFFFIVFSLIFFVYKEELLNNRKMLIKLLVLEFFILVEPFTILHSSIAYLIIAISIKRKEKAWLIPLVLIREQAFWILLGYYILSSENIDKKLVKYSIISSILYLIVRFIILKDAPYYYNEELFPIIVMLNSSVSKDIIIQASVMIPLTLVYSLLFLRKKFDFYMIVWNYIILSVFAIFWETQLWYPIFLIAILDENREVLFSYKAIQKNFTNLSMIQRTRIKLNRNF